eukprot:snap_masked-scaffold_5-processed-gene-9.7-mRNA-1 protein AED:1.00 eAED:1.00 QI:0/-1/0/0/-1/1/1/0/82
MIEKLEEHPRDLYVGSPGEEVPISRKNTTVGMEILLISPETGKIRTKLSYEEMKIYQAEDAEVHAPLEPCLQRIVKEVTPIL